MNDERQTRAIVALRSGGVCEAAVPNVCRHRAETMHHRLKRSHGGAWAPSNILHLCGDGTTGCHGWVEAHPSWANKEGLWLMAGDATPPQAAVHMRWECVRSWFVLDDTGMLEWDITVWEPVTSQPAVPASLRHMAAVYATMKP